MSKTRNRDYSTQLQELFKWAGKFTVREFTFVVTEECTLRCLYCYEHNKNPKRMSFEIGKQYIDFIFDNYQDKVDAPILDFIGGEPLLEPVLISKLYDYWLYKCIMENINWGKFTRVSLCSNGTEWDRPEVQELMKKLNGAVSFTVSIDGNKELHDSARLHPDGRGSYDEAIHAATCYEQQANQKLGSKMTIAPSNIIFTYSAIKHYLDQGKDEIFANCVFEEGWTYDDAALFYNELKKLADYKLEKYPEAYISLFSEDDFVPLPEEDDRNWCGGLGDMLACDTEGKLYPCLRYLPMSIGEEKASKVQCGDIYNVLDNRVLDDMKSVTRRSQSTDECFYCPIARGCAWCSAYNYESQGSYNKRATYICPMHKARALANVYYWNKYYRQIGSTKRKENYCPKEWALQIISEEEYNNLIDLTKPN